MRVGLVVVSHSAQLAAGVVELAAQMARDVVLVPAGGTDDGGIGTSLEKVTAALGRAETGSGVVVLTDLGSAVMTAEAALEFMGNPDTIVLADAPLVEGAVAAAVSAQSGAELAVVRKAAESALHAGAAPVLQGPDSGGAAVDGAAGDGAVGVGPAGVETAGAGGVAVPGGKPGEVTAVLTLINPIGLHARPAAALAGALGAMEVDIDINGADGQSVFLLMALGAGQGTELRVRASGPDAQRAVDLVRTEVESGFGEL
jgi:PTS hybrid protein